MKLHDRKPLLHFGRTVVWMSCAAALCASPSAHVAAAPIYASDFETPAQSWDAGFHSPMEPAGWYHGTNIDKGFEWAANNNGQRPKGGIVKSSGSDGLSHSGTQALYFEGAGNYTETKHVEMSVTKTLAELGIAPLQAGDTFTLGAWTKFVNWRHTGGNQDIYLAVRIKNASGNEIYYKDQGLTPVAEWTKFDMTTAALGESVVANAASVEFIIKYMAWNSGSASGTVYVDDFSASLSRGVKRPALPLLPIAAAPNPEIARKAYAWIASQQRDSGLMSNQLNDPFSGLYVDALAAFCFLREKEITRAGRMFDLLDAWRIQNWGTTLERQGFPQAWNSDTGAAFMDSDRWVGDNAWLLLALEYHRKLTGSEKYAAMRNAITDWLVALQDEADGGIKAGFNRHGPMPHKSTEGNLDCYAALVARPEARAGVLRWLEQKMWIPEEKRFRTGSTVDSTALDCVSWGVSALGPKYAPALEYAEKNYIITAPYDARPGFAVIGFGDLPGHNKVWFEGTGEMIVAYRVAGRHADAEKWMAAMDSAALPVGDLGAGWPCSSTEPPWAGGTTKPFVASGAWYLFGAWNFNPMDQSSWK